MPGPRGGGLATYPLGYLLDFTASGQESLNLLFDRLVGIESRWLFALGCSGRFFGHDIVQMSWELAILQGFVPKNIDPAQSPPPEPALRDPGESNSRL